MLWLPTALTTELQKTSGEAMGRMGRRALKYRLYENHGFLNSPHRKTDWSREVHTSFLAGFERENAIDIAMSS